MHWALLDLEDPMTEDLLVGIEAFQPARPNEEIDKSLSHWLRVKASTYAEPVWLWADGSKVGAFHTAEIEPCRVPNAGLVNALNCRFAARDARYPGAGAEIVAHLLRLARSGGQPVVTIDPFDQATRKPWLQHGFADSETRAQADPQANYWRMYLSV